MIGRGALRGLAAFLAAFLVVAVAVVPRAQAADMAKMKPGIGTLKLTLGPKDDPIPLTLAYDWPDTASRCSNLLMVVHGAARNYRDYLNLWREHAAKGGYIVVAPDFSSKTFPGVWRFAMGNVFHATGTRKPEAVWTFTVLEQAFQKIKRANKLTTKTYDIFGHSAGGQFVHRLVLFMPTASFRMAIAANAGWYTMPDRAVALPFGIKDAGMTDADLRRSFSRHLLVLLGERDNNPYHHSLNRDPEAMAEGPHRLARGKKFYATAKALAAKIGAPFNWTLATVPNSGHNPRRMSDAAAKYLAASPSGCSAKRKN